MSSRKHKTCHSIVLPFYFLLSYLCNRPNVVIDLVCKTDKVMCRHSAFVSDMSCITMPSEFCGQSKRGAQILSVTLHSEFHLIGRSEVAEAGLVFLMPLQLFLTEQWSNVRSGSMMRLNWYVDITSCLRYMLTLFFRLTF